MNFWHFFRNVNIEKISNVALICMLVNTTCLLLTAKDFIRHLMCKNPKQRFTCKQSLAYPWYVFIPC